MGKGPASAEEPRPRHIVGYALGGIAAAAFSNAMFVAGIYNVLAFFVGFDTWWKGLMGAAITAGSVYTYLTFVESKVSLLTWNLSGVVRLSARRLAVIGLVAVVAIGVAALLTHQLVRGAIDVLGVRERACPQTLHLSTSLCDHLVRDRGREAVAAFSVGAFWRVPLVFLSVAALIGLWRALRDATTRPDPKTTTPPRGTISVVHLSDLHITPGVDTPTLENHPSPNRHLDALVRSLESEGAHADAILITGDLTDSGSVEEWRALFRVWRKLPPELRARVVVVPGNHDINIASRRKWQVEPEKAPLRQQRLGRMLVAMRLAHGGRARALNDWRLADGKLIAVRRPFVAKKNQSTTWEDSFPMVVRCEGARPVNVVVLDSIAPAMNIVTNAFGHVSAQQLDRLERIAPLVLAEGLPILVCLHHHVRAPNDLPLGMERVKHLGMSVAAPNAVLAAIARTLGPVPIFHGHRHVARATSLANLTIIGATSTTLGGWIKPSPNERLKDATPSYHVWRMTDGAVDGAPKLVEIAPHQLTIEREA